MDEGQHQPAVVAVSASSAPGGLQSVDALQSRRYTISDQLCEVLAPAGAQKGVPYRWKDVIMMLIKYLMRRRPSLLDPNDGSRVLCAGDPIERVFGVSSFTKQETKLLVRQHVTLVEDGSAAPESESTDDEPAVAAKRGADADDGGQVKRGRQDGAATSAETAETLHDQATAGPSDAAAAPAAESWTAADVPSTAEAPSPAEDAAEQPMDEQSVSEEEDEEESLRRTYRREMEPVEPSDVDLSSTSGESDEEPVTELLCLTTAEADEGELADQEPSENEAELATPAHWFCQPCGRYVSAARATCSRCWTRRPSGFLVQKRRTRRTRYQHRFQTTPAADAAPAGSSEESGGSQGSAGSVSPVPGPSAEPATAADGVSSDPAAAVDNNCVICCENKSDVVIVHTRTGCKVACYKCAKMLWKRRDRCPSCRRTIKRIITLKCW